ncbi:MAG: hypothetical protein U0528_19350 [Anaerolineae bacterium]
MLENYSPLSLITRSNAIFDRELPRITTNFQRSVISGELTALAGILQIALMLFIPLLYRVVDPQIPQIAVALAAPLALQLLLSLILDIHGCLTAISLWQNFYRQERWDAVRLTALAEDDVVQAFYALAQVKLWTATRFESSLRLVLPGLLLTLGSVCSLPIGLIVGLVAISDFGSFGNAILFAALCGFMFSFGLTYVREPVWRLRLVTALALWSAARINGVSAALLAGAGVLLLRLVQFSAVYLIYLGALWLSAAPVGNFAVGVVLGVYFALLAVLLNPVMRLFHGYLSRWLIAQTTQFIRRGE